MKTLPGIWNKNLALQPKTIMNIQETHKLGSLPVLHTIPDKSCAVFKKLYPWSHIFYFSMVARASFFLQMFSLCYTLLPFCASTPQMHLGISQWEEM